MKPSCRVAIYIRTCLKENDSRIETQLHQLKSICADENKEVTGIFIDEGFSGLRWDRPSLQKLLAAAEEHAFDEVRIIHISHLSRNALHLINIVQIMKANGIVIQSEHQQVGSSQFLNELLAAKADMERVRGML